MEFWDGLVSTALVIGVGVCVLYVILSLAMPELAPEDRPDAPSKRISKDRWLLIAGVLYLAAIGFELGKGTLGGLVSGVGRLAVVGAGLAILTVLTTDLLVSIQRRFRPKSR